MIAETGKVSDALPDSWVYRLLPHGVWPYAQLARWERPIGWWLLMWPCWWSLALALNAEQSLGPAVARYTVLDIAMMIVLFVLLLLGAVLMRGAGCTYNDIVDIDLDAQVARTASRPIPSGRVSKRAAKAFLVAQALAGFVVLLLLCWLMAPVFNTFAFFLGIASLGIVALYPFAKRVTDWPQFVLGLAFSWGALMGWALIFESLSTVPLLLYAGSILWVIGYDTIYAHQDREDDALVGVRSTARLFGEKTRLALTLLYTGALMLMAAAYTSAGMGWLSYLGLMAGAAHMAWQLALLDIDDPDKCLALFKSNSTFGWIVFAGLILDIPL